jgi:hypothetical protein
MQRTRRLGLAAAVLPLVLPAPAEAHGLTGRADLPIPIWLFSWGAAVVLVLSFAALGTLWSEPRLERDRFRPRSAALGRLLTSRVTEVVCGALGAALLVLVIGGGLFGTQSVPNSFTPTFVYVGFWLGLLPLSVLFGDVFAAFNPWRAIGRAVGWTFRGLGSDALPYPRRLGYWPAAAGLFAFASLELVSTHGDRPRTIAIAALVYSAATWIGMALYGVDAWTRRGEAFSVYFNLFSRLSVFELRDRVLGTRPFLSGLARVEPVPGIAALVMTMIGSVTFDGISAGPTWLERTTPMVSAVRDLGFRPRYAVEIVYGLGLLAFIAAVYALYRLAVAGVHSVDRSRSAGELGRIFAPSLVPIALAYAAAHYISLLIYQGQELSRLASDPFGSGWDLFGTASWDLGIGFISAEVFWYLQLAFVVGGHVAALVLAHDRALALYPDKRQAVRSQYWMLAIMVFFTVLALWLLSEASKG